MMSAVLPVERRVVRVRGIVQGVGFRPFIYALAGRHGLTGMVGNDAEGVFIEVEGTADALDAFLREIEGHAPPLAVIEGIGWRPAPVRGDRAFFIEGSRAGTTRQTLISPDVATCADCLRELFDPANRRYRYPFINCTNCGPRFTITRDVPYDRAATTMADFPLCPACRAEYDDPADRRFHAQPNACPVCGPRVRLLDRYGRALDVEPDEPIARAADLLRTGAIVAVKGLGGYHLACNPFDDEAVRALRSRKTRQDKPFALMARDLEQVAAMCRVGAEEAALLAAPSRPIVLLDRRAANEGQADPVAGEVAPRQRTLGVMLAYTPLHHILLHDAGIPLVMTSGNRSDEPIAYRDKEALEQLGGIADYFLVHDRAIHMRCDDSVTRFVLGGPAPVRRSRGSAPAPVSLAQPVARHILACGGELKNTVCLARKHHAFLSHHIGDLENYQTLRSFTEGIEHYGRLFAVRPELIAYDLHPEYLSTKYARGREEEEGIAAVGVQHHHAHIAACLADNHRPRDEQVTGVALDGTGYGTDGAIWGGEFFTGSIENGFVRQIHLAYVPLPGGSAAIRQPWRMAVAHLLGVLSIEEILGLPLPFVAAVGEQTVRAVAQMARTGLNAPLTSSAGRLFDAVAALLGLPGSLRTTYEGQAAIELELAADGPAAGSYPFVLQADTHSWVIETRDTMAAILADSLAGVPAGDISARFHRTVAEMVVAGCRAIRPASGRQAAVALSGGTFQNVTLLRRAVPLLEENGFTVYLHHRVPTNDGGLSLGQAVLADSIDRAGHG
jgi:hydrogenase maturation protein HypF